MENTVIPTRRQKIGGYLLAGAVLHQGLFVFVAALLILWSRKQLMSPAQYAIIEIVGVVLSVLWIGFSLYLLREEGNRKAAARALVTATWISGILVGLRLLFKAAYNSGVSNAWLLVILAGVIAAMLLVWILHIGVQEVLAAPERIQPQELGRKNLLLCFCAAAGALVIGAARGFLPTSSVLGMLGSRILAALLQFLLAREMLMILVRNHQGQEQVYTLKPSRVRTILVVALGVVLTVGSVIGLEWERFRKEDPIAQVDAMVTAPTEAAARYMEQEQFVGALRYLDLSDARYQAVAAFSTLDGVVLEELRAQHRTDPFIAQLYLLMGGDDTVLTNLLISGVVSDDWYPMMLQYFAEKETLEPTEQKLVSAMLLDCIQHDRWTISLPDWKKLSEVRLKLLQELGDGSENKEAVQAMQLLITLQNKGGVSKEAVDQALTAAEEMPESMLLQYLAFQTGSNYQIDSAEHYQRTVEAARRYDQLFSQIETEAEEQTIEKMDVAAAAFRCYDFATAGEFYQKAYELDSRPELLLMEAACQERQEDFAGCLSLAEQVLAEDPQNDGALYLICINALKTGDIDRSLEAAGLLSELLRQDPTQAKEQELYTCAQYLVLKDDGSWTDYTFKVFDTLTEAQIQKAQSYPLLWNYLSAVNACFNLRDTDETTNFARGIEKDYADSIFSRYLIGAVLYDQGGFVEALDSFQKAEDRCTEPVPALLFSIAQTYDALEDYEKSYQYSMRVKELLPEQDHGNDIYGISIHNDRLLDALKSELGKEG